MTPRYYVNIKNLAANTGVALPVVAGSLLYNLHGFFRQNPGMYAIALPANGFGYIRVFAETTEAVDMLRKGLGGRPISRGYCQIGEVLDVPKAFNGQWMSFSRYRIPTRKSDRDPGARLRARRIEQADKDRMPYFMIRSNTNGNCFSLYVSIKPAQDMLGECLPDSYGLSVASRPFALPNLSFV